MKLVVGLGNPGPEYAETRHNAGFHVVAELARRHGIALARERRFQGRFGRGRIGGVEAGLLEPHTFMNLSGKAVLAAAGELRLGDLGSDLVVIYDDLDLPFGRLRIRPGGGAGGQKGLADIQARLGRSDFPRLRVGIGRPPAGEDPVEYVLAPFDAGQRAALPELLDRAADAVEAILVDGVQRAMNRFNAGGAVALEN
ncbi:aminoacyl-tRNA hydrolase [Myxococcota bacterium]|nr:aminoacyl-tRNA hydrolase [Myxococcota bacterium]MCZ7616953.1 aminoacyl-tRNA hydrolase [Myxococcota bacterium]